MEQKQKLTIVVGIIIVLIILVAWYIFSGIKSTSPITTSPAAAVPATTSASLGTQIYQQSQNPIQNKIPAPKNPSVNPLGGAYTNPFK